MAADEKDLGTQDVAAPRKRARAAREPAGNAISAGRKPRKAAARAQAQAAQGPADATQAVPEPRSFSQSKRADSDPWTVPQSVRDRFVQEGHRFYFPDGHEAFKDRGVRLTTGSENTQVVHSLVEIAQSRGWTQVTVTGTERFRQEAWRQARLAGLEVRGYRPSEEERAQLIRALARNREGTGESSAARPVETPAELRPAETPGVKPERIRGTLLEHGRDSYRHDPNEAPSYFVRLQTLKVSGRSGERISSGRSHGRCPSLRLEMRSSFGAPAGTPSRSSDGRRMSRGNCMIGMSKPSGIDGPLKSASFLRAVLRPQILSGI